MHEPFEIGGLFWAFGKAGERRFMWPSNVIIVPTSRITEIDCASSAPNAVPITGSACRDAFVTSRSSFITLDSVEVRSYNVNKAYKSSSYNYLLYLMCSSS
jgi:hypothetical protein